jgi:hypothetical protein
MDRRNLDKDCEAEPVLPFFRVIKTGTQECRQESHYSPRSNATTGWLNVIANTFYGGDAALRTIFNGAICSGFT